MDFATLTVDDSKNRASTYSASRKIVGKYFFHAHCENLYEDWVFDNTDFCPMADEPVVAILSIVTVLTLIICS